MLAYFFDMDGVLVDSLPNHAAAWAEVLPRYGVPFTPYDCYINEGRTAQSTITIAMRTYLHREPTNEEIEQIYREKCAGFERRGGAKPMKGVGAVLQFIHNQGHQIWVVTGSAQHSLIDNLDTFFPGIFSADRMITAESVQHGKPNPEPYLKAWEKCGLPKSDCRVIENAPLGVRAGKAAELTVYAVNTGILKREDLLCENADRVFDNMAELLEFIQVSDK